MKRATIVTALLILAVWGSLNALNDMPLLAQLQGEHNASGFGNSIVSLDFNHDGYDDLIVLSAGYGWVYPYTPSRGKVYIYYGGAGFSSDSEPAMTLEGDYPEGMQRKIGPIVNIGDVNGDGFDDLMIEDAIPSVSGSARYKYYYGGTSDLSTPDRIDIDDLGEEVYAHFKLGDVDGDGFDDIGIRYRQNQLFCFDIQWSGSFYRQLVYSGSEILGYASFINGIGDINGDGYHDFTIGYMSDETEPPSCIIKIYYGNPDRFIANSVVLINTQNSITRKCKPLGDVNGDGYDDFFAYASNEGMMLWMGTHNLDPSDPYIVLNPVYFGNDSLRGIEAGDINGDGFYDVVGASYPQQRFAVWLGNPSMSGRKDWQKTNALENYGYDLAVGDFNGDGYDDIAVSAPFEQGDWPTHDFRGYVLIYADNPGMVASDDPLAPQLSDQLQMKLSPNPVRSGNEINIEIRNVKGVSGNPAEI